MRKNRPASSARPGGFRVSKTALIKIVLAAVALSALYSAFRKFTHAPFFLVREVIVRQDGAVRSDSSEFNYLRGRNIFALDVYAESRRIRRFYPGCQQVRLLKFYPDRIFVDFIKRRPLACLRAAKTWYIDEDQVVFELSEQPSPPSVPVLTGIEKEISSADVGRRLQNFRVSQALAIIGLIKNARALSGYALTRMDVNSPASFTLFFDIPVAAGLNPQAKTAAPASSLKVKIGLEDFRQKLSVLETVLAQVENRLYTIEYIDLRFKDPVIKFRERI